MPRSPLSPGMAAAMALKIWEQAVDEAKRAVIAIDEAARAVKFAEARADAAANDEGVAENALRLREKELAAACRRQEKEWTEEGLQA